MAVPDHPMRALKGTPEAKKLMAGVRSHKKGAPETKPPAPTGQPRAKSYREIADRHTTK